MMSSWRRNVCCSYTGRTVGDHNQSSRSKSVQVTSCAGRKDRCIVRWDQRYGSQPPFGWWVKLWISDEQSWHEIYTQMPRTAWADSSATVTKLWLLRTALDNNCLGWAHAPGHIHLSMNVKDWTCSHHCSMWRKTKYELETIWDQVWSRCVCVGGGGGVLLSSAEVWKDDVWNTFWRKWCSRWKKRDRSNMNSHLFHTFCLVCLHKS